MSEMREEVNCTHEPDSPIAAFWFICKHCKMPIEAESCDNCDGFGTIEERKAGEHVCQKCKGSGVQKWTLMNLPSPIGGVTNDPAD